MGAPKYLSIQVVRALAAVIVVIHHSTTLSNDITVSPPPLPGWVDFGFGGVDLFFVVSGFIISLVTAQQADSVLTFLRKRALRIYPFYWLFTAAWLLVAWLGHKPAPEAGVMLASVTGFPMWQMPALGVGWSLEHEFIFYGLAAALIAWGQLRWLPHLLAGLFSGGVLLHVVYPAMTGERIWDGHVLSLYQLEFLLGVLIYRQREWLSQINWSALVVAGAFAFPLACALTRYFYPEGHVATQPLGVAGLVRVLSFGVASALLVSGAVAAEAQRPAMFSTRAARVAVLVGSASFGLYLLHPTLFAVLGRFYGILGVPEAALWPALALGWVSATIAAIAWYQFGEAPYLRLVTQKRWAVALARSR